ncbi:Recombination protein RecR [Trichinella spiralis]|uniref:Recombination protein RecR n=1 Tax=Trichinella spiralis TaxID=6334 RepID=A0ABR3KW51_TRISP
MRDDMLCVLWKSCMDAAVERRLGKDRYASCGDKSHVDMCILCEAPRSMRAAPLVALRPKAAAALVNTGFCC